MRIALLLAVVLVGCKKPDEAAPAAGGSGAKREARHEAAPEAAPDFVLKNCDILNDAYRANPAAADKKYKGKVCQMPMARRLERRGDKTVLLYGFTGAMKRANPDYPDLVVEFISEDEPAKMENKFYTVKGTCRGMTGNTIHVTDARVLGEWIPPELKK